MQGIEADLLTFYTYPDCPPDRVEKGCSRKIASLVYISQQAALLERVLFYGG